jgi:hypothetical protein
MYRAGCTIGHLIVTRILFAVQALYCIVMGVHNAFLTRVLFFYMITLLALFGNFFAQKHLAGSSKKSKVQ